MIKLSPSVLSADLLKLGEDVKAVEKFGADMIHIDVMDGKFVPNITFGMPVVSAIRKISNLTLDVHLMIEEPSKYVADFAKAGADIITIHYESDIHIDRTVNYIKSFGKKAGIAVNPATPVSLLKHLIEKVDMILIMSVNPGFGGQSFIDYTLNKITDVKNFSEKCNPSLMIQVDGGINPQNIGSVVKAGANVIVAGSSIFNGEGIEKNISMLKEGV